MDNRHIQMLRLFLPYTPPIYRKYLAIYIKFMELKALCHPTDFSPDDDCSHNDSKILPDDLPSLFDDLIPLCSPAERENLSRIKQFFHQMQGMKEMMETMDLLTELAPEFFSGNQAEENPMADLASLMEIFQTMSKGDTQ